MFEEKIIHSVSSLPIDNIINGGYYKIEQLSPNEYTHNYFKYPCKFIPEIPRWAIKKYSSENDWIFDPFAGSGTTILEANLLNRNAYYTEIDEVAKLLILAKTTPLSENNQKCALKILNNIRLPLEEAKNHIPKINNLEHWFSPDTITELSNIKAHIDTVTDSKLKNFLLICFASIIKKVSNADSISPKPYVSTKIKKQKFSAYVEFTDTTKKYLNNIRAYADLQTSSERALINGDALNFTLPQKVTLAVTSPPYINAFDYARTMRLENLWLGLQNEASLLEKKKDYVGTEKIHKNYSIPKDSVTSQLKSLSYLTAAIRAKDSKRATIVEKFFYDMEKNISLTSEALIDGGVYVIVIGNSEIRQVLIESWKILLEIAQKYSFNFELHFEYLIQNPYIRIPRGNKSKAIKTDHVLVLRKKG